MELNIVSFHGLYSQGNNLEILVNGLEAEAKMKGVTVVTSQHDYPKLRVTMGMRKWARNIVRDYILKCLALEFYKFPEAELIVICHSNATWGISRAFESYYDTNAGLCEKIRVDKLILFGSTVKRDFDWGKYPTDVINFVGTKDRVVWFSKFYGMGTSGRRGFIPENRINNLTQFFKPWKHSDFVLPKNFDFIKDIILEDVI